MSPAPGSRLVRYVGDRLALSLGLPASQQLGWKAFLRTNLTRANRAREEVVALAGSRAADPGTYAGVSWRDIPLHPCPEGWTLDLPLTETGFFRAKAYAVDPSGHQHWPEGEDLGVSVLPDHLRTGNTLYCAFPRMFGASRARMGTSHPALEAQLDDLDRQGFTVIPPSGKLRDLTACVPHILERLNCRILHLLPVGPTPTTYARMGRFGSPYAQLDLEGIDPALVAFDRRTTAEDQFRELATAVHLRGGLLFLDIVINHTGWGSRLLDTRPDWFHRDPEGTFHSPGAWGTVWEDLVELDQTHPPLWEVIAEALLTWCRRGVDGFRCDAGYMVPPKVWQYILARVRQEFPDTTFLLEGLGGAWDLTETLLTDGGMQWAYSELFQNHDPRQVSGYLSHALHQAERMGPLVHYSETHDNARLAAKGPRWSLMRNRLCALTSHSGAFGFTGGVEWLATEQIRVHGSTGMAWGNTPNLVPELATLNALLRDHPCFHDGARVTRLSPDDAWVLVLSRTSAEGLDACLVLVNLDPDREHWGRLSASAWRSLGRPGVDLLGQDLPGQRLEPTGDLSFHLAPGAAHCLSAHPAPQGLAGEAYRTLRAQAAWAYRHLAQALPTEALGPADWKELGGLASEDPFAFLACLGRLDPGAASVDLAGAIRAARRQDGYPRVIRWSQPDATRHTVVPPDHWLLVTEDTPFALTLCREGRRSVHLRSIPAAQGHVAAIFPANLDPGPEGGAQADLTLERFGAGDRLVEARLLLAPREPAPLSRHSRGLVLLTNGRGGMTRLHADLGSITSKYDCLLGANLHPAVPCDRHVMAKRLRLWANADGFITALDGTHLVHLEPGPPARWVFVAPAGDGRTAEIALTIQSIPGRNTVHLRFERTRGLPAYGEDLPEDRDLRLTLRLDLEDRSYHQETLGNGAADAHFRAHTRPMEGQAGFLFSPAPDRTLAAWMDDGLFHPQPEWSFGLSHAVEASRGMTGQGDTWSPGWFEAPLARGRSVDLVVTSELLPVALEPDPLAPRVTRGRGGLEGQLLQACMAFLARRDEGLTVIAGFPWFLDWGRDTLIACRGLIAAGLREEVLNILRTFAAFEDRGTLPNALAGASSANRETSDAPLWFGLACEEAANAFGGDLLAEVLPDGRTLLQVLASIAAHHLAGTPVGVRVDLESGLVWSPSHFTWMDTNHPAGTPRQGYPVELQALWIRLLRFLERQGTGPDPGWADRAERSLDRFWLPEAGWFTDCLLAGASTPAREARPDGHLRPNQLFLVSLGLVHGPMARSAVAAAGQWLLVPGAMRTLAPLPVPEPLPIHGQDGHLLNDPWHPYWGRYEGDEDTRRKPAYHNGTAWCWPMPTWCEALVTAWPGDPAALNAARSVLATCDQLLGEGCLGHLPEILDGNAPHAQRGCDAQAWSVTEAFRVWRLISRRMEAPPLKEF